MRLFELLEDGSDGETALGEDARERGVGERGISEGSEVADDAAFPVVVLPVGDLHVAEYAFRDGVDQIVLVVDVTVERHGSDAEVFGECGAS